MNSHADAQKVSQEVDVRDDRTHVHLIRVKKEELVGETALTSSVSVLQLEKERFVNLKEVTSAVGTHVEMEDPAERVLMAHHSFVSVDLDIAATNVKQSWILAALTLVLMEVFAFHSNQAIDVAALNQGMGNTAINQHLAFQDYHSWLSMLWTVALTTFQSHSPQQNQMPYLFITTGHKLEEGQILWPWN